MMNYTQITFTNTTPDTNNMLCAMLAPLLFEGFEEEDTSLKAYILSTEFVQESVDEVAQRFSLSYSVQQLAQTNWNELWESNFQPVIVDSFCAVRASFHQPLPDVQHEIVITPKMSFGTGHHPTTSMMIRQMRDIPFHEKTVLDFGTGTGVLAILAEKLGAAKVLALDNDDWSITNAAENFSCNNTSVCMLEKAEAVPPDAIFDIILANITRNVILDNFGLFSRSLTTNGILLLSGLLREDLPDISKQVSAYGFRPARELISDNWVCIKLIKI